MNNVIDIQTGQLELKGCFFYYKMTFEQALNLSADFKYETLDHKNGYKWIYLKEIDLNVSLFHFGLCFKNEHLFQVDFGFSSPDEIKKTWADWSKENELSRKKLYEKWLTENLSGKRNFKWGKIEPYYDPRGGTTGILINYKNNESTTMHKSNGGESAKSNRNINNKSGSWWRKLWS